MEMGSTHSAENAGQILGSHGAAQVLRGLQNGGGDFAFVESASGPCSAISAKARGHVGIAEQLAFARAACRRAGTRATDSALALHAAGRLADRPTIPEWLR